MFGKLCVSLCLLLTLAAPVTVKSAGNPLSVSCSCAAPDGSCSASVTCRGDSCYAFCSNQTCLAGCGAPVGKEGLDRLTIASLEVGQMPGQEWARQASQASGRAIIFKPYDANLQASFDFKNLPLWDALDLLSQHGQVAVDGNNFETLKSLRATFRSGEKFNVCFQGVTAQCIQRELSFISGFPIALQGDSETRISLKTGDGVTLAELLKMLNAQEGLRFEF